MFNKKTIRDIDVKGKRVLVRVDFNVPIKDGQIGDDTRIIAAIPTLEYLIDHGASLILCSHLGRPKGEPDQSLSLRPVATRLSELLGRKVAFSEDSIGPLAKKAAKSLEPGDVLLLENTRFHPEENKNDDNMATQLAELADIFVNDAFGSAHRAHASTVGVAQYIPAVAGFLMEREIQYLGQAIANPERPFVAILGGAKISEKIGVVRNLLEIADQVLIGGGMANTFFKAQGYPIGESLAEDNALDTARDLINVEGFRLRLPIDVVIADDFTEEAEYKSMAMGPVPDCWRIMDIGDDTVSAYRKTILDAGTIVWNGPMGVFEFQPFAKGTYGIAKAVAESNAISIVGGGDSAAAVKQAGLADQITHISTGGGASLEMLEGVNLPGLSALEDKD